ncbi:MAG: DNA polymerase III subunit delta' [Anaerolineae bacterium]|nr:MAG: putative DNA polymerase III delta' subunit [Chloroflexi bacterium OLB13]MBW7878082.1 DNA polymerase III subunit delta' [Anaerolineae bacterium]MDL1915567.1 DNA polymerase III subunit delta' [Anaerolineae bacterium CFX4]MEB2364979.1 DNA polymerase III subunit [Chloroflexota bacterium]
MNAVTANDASHWGVFGHDWAVDYLRKGLRHGRTRQAYLFTGTPGIGKTTLAHAFAAALNCQHPDVDARPCGECRSCRVIASGNHPDILYAEEDDSSGTLKIEALRDLMRRLALKPYDARYRVAIVPGFERARGPAQDAILKTLEEPPPYAVLILLANGMENTLATIQSRCQIVYLKPVAAEIIAGMLRARYGTEDERAVLIARLSGGRIGWAVQAVHDDSVLEQRGTALDLLESLLRQSRRDRFALANDLAGDKPALLRLLELWQTYWRDLLLLSVGNSVKPVNIDRIATLEQLSRVLRVESVETALRQTQRAQTLIQGTNVNVRLLLEVLFLDYPAA